MVSRLDRTVGRILARLKEKRIERETLVIFTSDNGPTHGRVGGADSPFFRSAGGLRGLKGSVYEGGIRVPFIAWQPGTIPAGTSSDELAGFWDLMPTIADVASAELPPGTDGVSLAGLLSGRTRRLKERPLYWEFPGYGGQQALRAGRWKAVRQQMRQGPIRTELYDLIADPAEARDLAAVHGGLVKRMEREMSRMREPSALFPLPGVDRPGRN
jgi:arylsulfatase